MEAKRKEKKKIPGDMKENKKTKTETQTDESCKIV
jgi:hypothetical protein